MDTAPIIYFDKNHHAARMMELKGHALAAAEPYLSTFRKAIIAAEHYRQQLGIPQSDFDTLMFYAVIPADTLRKEQQQIQQKDWRALGENDQLKRLAYERVQAAEQLRQQLAQAIESQGVAADYKHAPSLMHLMRNGKVNGYHLVNEIMDSAKKRALESVSPASMQFER